MRSSGLEDGQQSTGIRQRSRKTRFHQTSAKLPEEEQDAFNVDFVALQNGLKPLSVVKNVTATVGKGAFELIRNGS
jgi:hypothetical protein